MNQLSWLLYLAGVCGNLGVLFGFAGLVFACVAGMAACAACDGMDRARPYRWLFIPAALMALLAAMTPSKDTVYAIAASQMGEQVLKSPVAAKAEKALDAWLDRQIAKKAD